MVAGPAVSAPTESLRDTVSSSRAQARCRRRGVGPALRRGRDERRAGGCRAAGAGRGGRRDRRRSRPRRTRLTWPTFEEMHALRDATLERFGSAHLVCLNAGVAPTGGLLDTTIEVFEWVLDVNLRGVVYGAKAFAPVLVEQGERAHRVHGERRRSHRHDHAFLPTAPASTRSSVSGERYAASSPRSASASPCRVLA